MGTEVIMSTACAATGVRTGELTAREVWALELERVWRDLGYLAAGSDFLGHPIEGARLMGRPTQGQIPRELLLRLKELRGELRRITREAAPWVASEVIELPGPPAKRTRSASGGKR